MLDTPTEPATQATTNLFDVLKSEHRKVADQMARIEENGARPDGEAMRAKLFRELRIALYAHARAEEEVLYPVFRKEDAARDITLEGIQEHRVIHGLLRELEEMATKGEVWTAKFKVLKENVEHHVEEEEGEMFPQVRSALGRDAVNALTPEYERARRRFEKEAAAAR